MDLLETERIKTDLLFLKQQHWHHSPKALRLLAWKAKQKKAENTVHFIRTKHGDLSGSSAEILQSFEGYHQSLYTLGRPELKDIDNFFLNSALFKQLSDRHKSILDGKITQDEIKDAIKQLKNNKAAGADGYPTEFFKTFMEDLLPSLEKTYDGVLFEGIIPPSWREAVLILIPKPGKDKTLCKSYRPITLLNVDLKIFTTILAKRLQRIVTQYVNVDQTGFMPGRSITDNIRKTLNLIGHCRAQKLSSLLLAIDFEKAFDSVEFPYLTRLLRSMNFGDHFLRAIEALYHHPTARVQVNNRKSASFSIGRGTRQGCPLSPLLFALCIEPLANLIRLDEIGAKEYRLSLFADDVVVYLSSPDTSLSRLQDILAYFRDVSGLQMNATKSEAYPMFLLQEELTRLKNRFRLNWVSSTWRHLGVEILARLQDLYKSNFGTLFRDTKQRLHDMSRQGY